jgi:hypothetical protein
VRSNFRAAEQSRIARFEAVSQKAVEHAGILHYCAAGSSFRSWRAHALNTIKDAPPATILP